MGFFLSAKPFLLCRGISSQPIWWGEGLLSLVCKGGMLFCAFCGDGEIVEFIKAWSPNDVWYLVRFHVSL